MSRGNVVRLGAVAAIVGGLFSLCVNAAYSLLLASSGGAILGPVGPLLTLAGIITTLLYVAALVGLYALSGVAGDRSWLGVAGLSLSCLAFLTTLIPWTFGVAYVLYQIVFVADGTVTNPIVVFPQAAVDLTGDGLLACGVLLLALGALRGRALGRWAFVPFVIAFLSFLPLLFWATYALGLEIFGWLPVTPSLLRAPFWVLLGGVLWWRAATTEARTGTTGATPAGPAREGRAGRA